MTTHHLMGHVRELWRTERAAAELRLKRLLTNLGLPGPGYADRCLRPASVRTRRLFRAGTKMGRDLVRRRTWVSKSGKPSHGLHAQLHLTQIKRVPASLI